MVIGGMGVGVMGDMVLVVMVGLEVMDMDMGEIAIVRDGRGPRGIELLGSRCPGQVMGMGIGGEVRGGDEWIHGKRVNVVF